MKASMKRIIILFLVCGLICVGSLKAQAASLSQKEMDEVTRIEWLKALTETFEMTVEEDNYPDNYYSDMDSSSENYYEVMLATEFGLVDVEAGDPLRPDEPATREFVAHTINLCMGYQLEDDTYTFSEATSVTYPQDIQIAIDKGWLELVDGNFLPEQGITSAEKTKMIDAAKEAVESTKLDTNHKDAYKLAEGVVAIPSGTEVELTDENEWTIYDCDVKLKAGDIFAIVADGLPMAKKVVSVQTKDGNIIVHVDNVEIEEAFESIDVQGTIAADLTKTQTLEDDVTLTYVVGGTEERNYEDGIALNSLKEVEEQEKEVTAVIASKTIEIPNDEISTFGIEADPGKEGITFNCKITNVSIDYNVSLLDLTAYLKVNSKVTFSCDIEGIDKEIPYFENPFVKVPIGVVGFFEPVAEGRIKGSISLALSANTTVGVQYDHGSIRGIFDFKKAAFTISAKAEVTLGVKAAVGVDVAFLKAELYIKGGAKGTAKITKYTDNPQRCTHFTAHLYSAAGGKVTFKVFGYKSSVTLEQTIMDEKNSPVRISVHYEDGTPVSVCSRDSKIGTGSIGIISGEKYKYYSPFYSQYVDSGINSGTGADGEPYTIFEYTLDDNDQATITKYNGNVAVLNIPETIDGYRVVGIGNNVFENNQRLMIVKIPDSVTTIQRYAFSNCSNLIQVKLSKSLIEMGTASFSKCNSLAEIEIPKSLDKVSVYGFSTEGAFVKCDNLKTVKFEEGTTQIATNLFYGCTGLEEIIIPDTVTVIEANAFHDCSNLKTVDIPTSVTEIEEYAFKGCKELTEIIIPDSVTQIKWCAFESCGNLATVKLSKSLTEMWNSAFAKCNSLTEIEIPKSLTKVCTYGFSTEGAFANCDNLKTVRFEEGTTQVVINLFSDCTGLEEIVIPGTVTIIGANSFCGCSNLRSVSIPESVVEIGEYAFNKCKKLTEITIPDSVTKIKWCAFQDCSNLERVKLSKSLTEMWNSTFARCNSLTEIEIPKSLDKVSTYGFSTEGAFANCDNLENVRFEEGTTQIAANLFHDCTGLKQIVVPDTVTVIETNAFQGCSNLYNITIPQTVTEIGDNAFEGCSKLAEIEIPQKVTTIGNNAFKNCTELKEIEIPNSVTGMGNYVFMNCTALANVKLPNIRKNITEGMFKNCTALKSITLPDSVTRIAGSAFYNSGLETITLSSKLQIIEGSAFRKCTALQSIIIQDSVTSIGSYCFAECEALSSIQLGNGLTKIEQYTFNQCPALQKVTLPYRLTSVAANAFTNCTQLTEVVIPRATTSIANNVFSYPTKMTVYGVAGTYAETWASSVGAKFVNQEKTAEDVQLNESAVVVNKGETYALVVTVTPKDFTDTISWKSSNTSVATVSETGVITAKGIGTATIRVAVGNVSASCKVTVVQPVTNIYLNKTSVSMEAENTEQLTASVYPSTANDKTVTWSSTDELVAAVDQTGKVTALKKGSTVITAMANDGSGISQSCNVTVTSTLFHCTTVDQLESMHNYENNCKDIWEHTLPGVNRMAVTFDSQTYMEDEFDYLYLYDGNGTEIGKYTGDALAGKTIIINGDTIKLKMDSDDSGNAWGFKVTKVEEYCEHTYETTWSSDETYHWHAAVCGHEPADKEEHISGEWIVDEAPTEEVGGSKHRECTVCGRILETQEIDQLINPSKELLRRLETAVNESMDVSSNLTSENYGQASEDERRQAVYDVLQQINENCQKQNIEQLGLVSAEDAVPLVQQLANIETRISELLSTSVTVIAKNEQTEYSLPQVSNALLSVPAGENATILVDYEKNIAIADADMTGALTVDMKLVSEENEELKLKVPVVVSMSIPENLDPEQPIVVYHYNDDSTEYDEVISTQVDSGNGIITFVTGSFNTFIVANKAKGVNLSGKILSFGEENEPIKIELLNMAGGVIGETEVYGNAAAYNLESIQPGTYQVRVSKKNHVTRLYEIIADEQNLELDMQILLLGDVTGDGKINVKDKRAIFKQLQGNGQLSDYLLSVGDVNGDGVINVKDKRLFYKHIAGTVSIWK